MDKTCPDCGTPLSDIPFRPCRTHDAWFEEQLAEVRRKWDAKPIWEKLRVGSDEDRWNDLADWLEKRGLK